MSENTEKTMIEFLDPYGKIVDLPPIDPEGAVRLREIIAELEAMDAPVDSLVDLADEWEGISYEHTFSPLMRIAMQQSRDISDQKVFYWGTNTTPSSP